MIEYKTYKYPGKFDKSVTIFTGPDGEEETLIRLIGAVDPIPMGVLRMEPRKTEVGELALNKENEVRIILENDGDARLTVTRIVSLKSEIEYYSGQIEIAPGESQTVAFAVRPQEPGRYLERIVIHSDARNDTGNGYSGLLSGTVVE